MFWIRKFLTRISHAGIHPKMPPAFARRILTMNLVSFTIFLVTWPYIWIFRHAGAVGYSNGVFFIAGGYLVFIALNAFGYYNLSRLLMLTHFNAAVFIYADVFGERAGIHLCFFTLVCLPLMIFQLKDRLKIAYGTLLPVLGYAALGLTDFALFPDFPVAVQTQQLIYWAIVFSNFIMLWAAAFYFYRSNEIAEVRLERSLEQVLDQQSKLLIAAKMSSLGEMASGIAHEVNNPLLVIQLKAGQLQELEAAHSLDRESIATSSRHIEQMVERISKIISSLRSFAREGSNDPMSLVPCHLIVEDTLGFCRERFRNHGVNLIIDDFSPKLTVKCRAVEISQVLLNLLNNGFDAAMDRPSNRWVRIGAIAESGLIRLSVTDSGPGVLPEVRDRIFEPFFTTKGVAKGTGLGLSISRSIVQNHGGTLFLDDGSAETRFVILLPQP